MLVQLLGSRAAPVLEELLDSLRHAIVHHSFAVRQAAAWCVRAQGDACPDTLRPLFSIFANQWARALKVAAADKPESISRLKGVGSAVAALLSCVGTKPLKAIHDMPTAVLPQALALAKEAAIAGAAAAAAPAPANTNPAAGLVAGDAAALATAKAEAAWLLIASCVDLGPAIVRGSLPELVLAWRGFQAPAKKDLKHENDWRHVLRSMESALGAAHMFLVSCRGELLTADATAAIAHLLTVAMTTSTMTPSSVKYQSGLLRARMYSCYAALPIKAFESHVNIVTSAMELFCSETTMTSMLPRRCDPRDALLGRFTVPTASIDGELESLLMMPTSAALEYDPLLVVWESPRSATLEGSFKLGVPLAPPPEVAAVDAAIRVFGNIFPALPAALQEKLLDSLLKLAKKKRAVSTANILCATLGIVKASFTKAASLKKDRVLVSMQEIITLSLGSTEPLYRCAAAEAYGKYVLNFLCACLLTYHSGLPR